MFIDHDCGKLHDSVYIFANSAEKRYTLCLTLADKGKLYDTAGMVGVSVNISNITFCPYCGERLG